jgi:hypothetical protein
MTEERLQLLSNSEEGVYQSQKLRTYWTRSAGGRFHSVDNVDNQTAAETISGVAHCQDDNLRSRLMPQAATHLRKRFPVGSKYVVESCGPFVRRYVEFPDGRKVPLPKRKALLCTDASTRPRFERSSRRRREQPEEVRRDAGF